MMLGPSAPQVLPTESGHTHGSWFSLGMGAVGTTMPQHHPDPEMVVSLLGGVRHPHRWPSQEQRAAFEFRKGNEDGEGTGAQA